jgi:hypothetical protein
MESIGKQLPIVKTEFKNFRDELSSAQVDETVDDIIREYGTPSYRKWYCELVYEFGPRAIKDLQGRCRDANVPSRLFAYLAKQMHDTRKNQRKMNEKL